MKSLPSHIKNNNYLHPTSPRRPPFDKHRVHPNFHKTACKAEIQLAAWGSSIGFWCSKCKERRKSSSPPPLYQNFEEVSLDDNSFPICNTCSNRLDGAIPPLTTFGTRDWDTGDTYKAISNSISNTGHVMSILSAHLTNPQINKCFNDLVNSDREYRCLSLVQALHSVDVCPSDIVQPLNLRPVHYPHNPLQSLNPKAPLQLNQT